MPIELTVAQVAAIINVAIIIVQATYPLLFALVGVGILKSKINAATWSVFGRLINGTHWPLLLRTDSASSNKVDKRIQSLTWTVAIVAVILGLAAIATPLGLASSIQLSEPQNTLFSYAKDTSPIGKATLPRDQYLMKRWCASGACPGNVKGYEYDMAHMNKSWAGNPWASAGIASNVTNVFTSATDNSTVASIFDIQYRSYYQAQGNETAYFDYYRNQANRNFTQGQFVYFQQFLLNDKFEVAEGVIISTTDSPGIGFRNHTLPPESKLGYAWDEDILWLEPETQCTNFNISLDYTVTVDSGTYIDGTYLDARITDRGGLVQVPDQFPSINLENTQSDPKLLERSRVAAVSTNKLLAELWRVNASYYGKAYYQNRDNSTLTTVYNPHPNVIAVSTFGGASQILNYSTWYLKLPGPLELIGSMAKTPVKKPIDIAEWIVPYSQNTTQGISKVGIGAGMVLGVGRQMDDDGHLTESISSTPLRPGLRWSHPLYSCVSAVKASVKTVSFKIDHETVLSNLRVTGMRPSNMTGRFWAVEKSRRPFLDGSPLWGLVSASEKDNAGISIKEQDSLYLPAGLPWYQVRLGAGLTDSMPDSLAGSSLPLMMLASLYDSDNTRTLQLFPDYSGANNWAMYTKWAKLSGDAASTSHIINLIWTDLMANAVMGSNSRLRRHPDATLEIPASRYVQTVSYDWRYASVALVFALVYVLLLLLSLFLYVIRAWNLGSLRFFLNQTSAGRSMTTERFEATNAVDLAKTDIWASGRGLEMIRIGKETVGSREPSLKGYQIVKTKDSSVL